MLNQFFTIGILQLLAVITPGPDFAMVVKNALAYNRRIGLFTALGITCGVTFHLSYCLLGFALIIQHSLWLFNAIKYAGAAYLSYIGIQNLLAKSPQTATISPSTLCITCWQAYQQGLWCNVLNPKAALFFLGLFTLVITPQTSTKVQVGLASQSIIITLLWFSLLAYLLAYPHLQKKMVRFQFALIKVMGTIFLLFGINLALFHH